MKKYLVFGASLLGIAALTSCSDTFRPAEDGDGEGRLMLKATVNSDVVVNTRAGQTNDELAQKTLIWISNAGGAVKKYNGIDEVPATGIKLLSGHYVAEAWAGDSVSASWDDRYFTGREEFDITKGSAVQVNIDCKIANTLVSVEYDEKVTQLLTDITMEVGHDKATGTRDGMLTFTQEKVDQQAKAYYMTNSRSKDLVYTLRGTLATNGSAFEYTGKLENVARATEYHLIVKHTDQEEEQIGGAWITIEVDETEIEVEDTFEITTPPSISGVSFNLSEPVAGMVGELPRRSLWIAAATGLTEVVVKSDAFATIAGLGGDDFELFGMNDNIKSVLEAAGINFTYETHADTGFSELKLNFEKQFLNSLPEGDYQIAVTATDANGRTANASMRVMPTNAKVMIQDIDPEALTITSRSAVVGGSILRYDSANWGIMFRKKGTQQWTKVAAEITDGNSYTVTLTGLEPATGYEAAAYCDGFDSNVIQEFTTEGEPQLPNASFEDWSTDPNEKNVLIPGVSPSDFYWDSGNHGSITMDKNITEKAEDFHHNGKYSAKLCSQFVGITLFGKPIGKFAAGNIFIGKYLETDGTDGVLGWGRSFTARPKALRVWVKYTPAAVTDVDNNNPDGVAEGDMDRGIVYIALVDNTKSDYKGEKWPVIVKTKSSDRSLFDKNGNQVIAYGEHVFTEATPGDGLVEVVIPIDYKRTDVRPSNIVMVASASKMGDYFTGGPSVMYLDDVELIYE